MQVLVGCGSADMARDWPPRARGLPPL